MYLSQDPIGLAGNNPTLYGYVKDVNSWVDVLGLLNNVFWSGGDIAKDAAEIFAQNDGAQILEMTPQGKALEEWTKNMDWETEANPLWQSTSASFAGSTTNGSTVHVFIYEPNYRGAKSVWEEIEKPILEKKAVTIIEHKIKICP
jgi:uncharacterized protein RhaS with RHS repeats